MEIAIAGAGESRSMFGALFTSILSFRRALRVKFDASKWAFIFKTKWINRTHAVKGSSSVSIKGLKKIPSNFMQDSGNKKVRI